MAAPQDHMLAGSTVLHIAAWRRPRGQDGPRWLPDLYRELCEKARWVLDLRNARGLVPLYQAASVGNELMFEALLEAGACQA
jgi:hypothetical protein